MLTLLFHIAVVVSVVEEVVVEVGRRIVHHIRVVDLLFRWGGEEFLLLLPGCAIPRAKELLERIRRDLHDQPVSLLHQKTVPPSSDQLRPDLLPVTIARTNLTTGTVQTTFFMFLAIFTLLLIAEISIMVKQINIGPEEN